MRTLVVLAAVLAGALGFLWLFQRRLIYLPDQRVAPPGAVLPGAREVTVATADGLELTAWYLPAGGQGGPPGRGGTEPGGGDTPEGGVPSPAVRSGGRQGTAVLVLPGNAGDRADRAPLARALSRQGLAVMLLDYRGYGGNPGHPTEEGLLADARAARRVLACQPGVERVVLFGESLGSAVAVAVAAEDPVAALILRSPFPSLAEVGRVHYPVLPVGLLLRDRFPVVQQLGAVAAPVLVVLGEADGIVPPDLSRRVHEAAGEPRRLLEIPGAGHNDAALLSGERLMRAVVSFLRDHGLLGPEV